MLKLIYDFDGTLTTSELPQYDFFKLCRLPSDEKELFNLMNNYANEHNVDIYTAYYHIIFDAMRENKKPFDDSIFCMGADSLKYHVGLVNYFKLFDADVEHYIVTSGIQNYIYHTKYAENFKAIYGTTFEYTKDGDIQIKDLVTDNNKIKKIDLIACNDFDNVIYIGDGLTDVPAFKYVSEKGGISILLSTNNKLYKDIISKGINVVRIKPDYKKDSELVKFIKDYNYYSKALKFMKFKHNNQKRKQGTMYYTHPLSVAKMLKEKGFNVDYQVAGLFHDLLEDTDTLNEEIFNYSNNEVLDTVVLVTKEKGYNMKDYISRINGNDMARMVKLADRIHNLKESSFGTKLWQKKYYKETMDWYVPMAKGTVFEKDLEDVLNIVNERINKK